MRFLLGVVVGLILSKIGYLEWAVDFMQWMDMIRLAIADFLLSL
jgi:hypothetical protein